MSNLESKQKITLYIKKLSNCPRYHFRSCGLLFLQIVPSSTYHQPVSLTDKIGRRYTIDLAQYGYALQKKADLIFPTLERWISKKNIDDAKMFLHSLVELIVARSLKGVQDQDPDLHKNAGIIDKSAVFIDVGSFHMNENAKNSEVYINDLRKITRRLSGWLKIQSPELNTYLEGEITRLENERALSSSAQNRPCQKVIAEKSVSRLKYCLS